MSNYNRVIDVEYNGVQYGKLNDLLNAMIKDGKNIYEILDCPILTSRKYSFSGDIDNTHLEQWLNQFVTFIPVPMAELWKPLNEVCAKFIKGKLVTKKVYDQETTVRNLLLDLGIEMRRTLDVVYWFAHGRKQEN